MDKSSLDSETGLWSIAIQNGSTKASDITTIKAQFVINAAGIDCDKVQSLAASVGSRGESTVPAPDLKPGLEEARTLFTRFLRMQQILK
jgi:glycerol-3-phosphate dehydrogenase